MNSIAAAMFFILAAIAVMHVLWGFGVRWPARNERELVASAIGRAGQRTMPPPYQCFLAAAAIFLAGVSALVVANFLIVPLPDFAITMLGALMFLVFGLRGMAAYAPAWREKFTQEPFATMDRTKFGPLCLPFALGFAALLVRRLGGWP